MTAALLCAVAAGSPPAAARQNLDAFEEKEQEACADGGGWVRRAAVKTYFADSFRDLDKHFSLFSATVARDLGAAAATTDPGARAARYASIHEQAKTLIPRLGRLLPRTERPLDLAPMVEQMLESAVRDPHGDHYTEYLRVALAREMLAVPPETARDPGPRIAAFLTYFAAAETQLLGLETGGGEDPEALRRNLQGLFIGWRDGFRPIAEHAIFAPYKDNLEARLASGVEAICAAQEDGDNR